MLKNTLLAILFFCGSLVEVSGQDPIPFTDGAKLGYVSRSFKWIIPPGYDTASDFHSGAALVSIGGTRQAIDARGKVLFTLRESLIAGFSASGSYLIVEEDKIGYRIYDKKGTRLGGPFRLAFFCAEGRVIVRSSEQDLTLWELPQGRMTRLPIKVEGVFDSQIYRTALPDVIHIEGSLYSSSGKVLSLKKDNPDLPAVMEVTRDWYLRWNDAWNDKPSVLAFFRWGESTSFRVMKGMFPALSEYSDDTTVVVDAGDDRQFLYNVDSGTMTILPSSGRGLFITRGRFYYHINPYLPSRPGQTKRELDPKVSSCLLGLNGEIIVPALQWVRDYGDVVMTYKNNEIQLLHRNGAKVSHSIQLDFIDDFGLYMKKPAMTMQRPDQPVHDWQRNS